MTRTNLFMVNGLAVAVLASGCGDGSTSPKRPADLISLQLGETRAITTSAGTPAHVDGGAEYVLVLNAPPGSADMTLQVTGENVAAAIGPPTPQRIGPMASPQFNLTTSAPTLSLDRRLREYERHHLAAEISAARRAQAFSRATSAAIPAAGDELSLNVSLDACGPPTLHQGRVMLVSDHAVFVEDEANPSGGFTEADYQSMATAYETVVYPVLTDNFGAPSDIDNNGGRTIMFFTRVVNEQTPPGSDNVVSSFFYIRDLLPKSTGATVCAGSNEAEMLYLLAPDPNGTINGHVRETARVRDVAPVDMTQSGQFLVNAGRRLYITHAPLEEAWLGEALSDVAAELAFYRAAGLAPRHNLTLNDLLMNDAAHAAVNLYQIGNLLLLQQYLAHTESYSPLAANQSAAASGAGWQLLRYAADHSTVGEQTFWKSIVNSSTVGMANLSAATGVSAATLLHDWSVAQYTDDAGFPVDATFQHPSWNFRSVLPGIHNGLGFPLAPHQLTSGAPVSITLKAGGASYVRFGVAAGQFGSIVVTGGTAATLPVMTLVRTK